MQSFIFVLEINGSYYKSDICSVVIMKSQYLKVVVAENVP